MSRRRAGFLVMAVTVVIAGVACREEPSAPLPGAERPLELLARPVMNQGGAPLDPADLAGKVVLVNFWSPG